MLGIRTDMKIDEYNAEYENASKTLKEVIGILIEVLKNDVCKV